MSSYFTVLWICVSRTEQTEERIQLLLEATILKIVSRTVYLTKEGGSKVSVDDVMVTIIADLQDQQDKESEALIKKLVDKVKTNKRHP